jgi:PAS domain S-box-containing protein
MDRDHRIVKINDAHARWYGHPPEWFVGRRCYEVFEKRQQICPHCPGVESMKTGEVGQVETEGVRDDGRRLNVRLHTAPYLQADGTLGFIEVVEDVTERRQIEAQSQQVARLADLGEMASGIAHEINNPVAGVISCAELLKTRLPRENPCQEIADRILREGNRIANIVKSLLSVAHPGKTAEEMFSVSESLASVMTLYEHKLEKAGINVSVEIAEKLPLVRGDRQKIEQVLLNLISNAYYALNARYPDGDPDKSLRIKACCCESAGQQSLRIEVHDTGAGIPDEIVGRIFDPFFTTKPAGSGTGIGLGICARIVKLHGGEIRVESEFGRYARFTVELPLDRT